jgi:hypothetical protein
MIRSFGSRAGIGPGSSSLVAGSGRAAGPATGARARAPSVARSAARFAIRGAAAPHRAWRLATAAVTSAGSAVIHQR